MSLSLPAAAPPQASGYHSTEDAQRMQALVCSMVEGRRPIALTSTDPELLAHYSRLLVRDLRQLDHVRIVAHLPGSHDKLVEQVNALLADVPLADSVRREAAGRRPVHVFVVHDSPGLAASEFALLVRLVSDLPGANLRIALIQDRDPALSASLQALGPMALHWHIQQPQQPGEPASAAPQLSREALKEALKEALLESPGTLPPWALPESLAPRRRRWRLAFWRREPQPALQAPAWVPRGAPGKAPGAKPAAKAAAKPAPRVPAMTARGKPKPGAAAARAAARPAGKAANTARADQPAGASAASRGAPPAPRPTPGRGHGAVLVGGLLLSGALAVTLGLWLSSHLPGAPGSPGARQAPSPSTVTASAGPSARPGK